MSDESRPRRMGRPPTPAPLRFWPKVNKNGPPPPYRPELGGCWLWMGAARPAPHGRYGTFRGAGSRMVMAHRWAWEDAHGPTDAEALDHLCRVTLCVRPSHLEPVTNRGNILRGIGHAAVNAMKETCPKGHVYDTEWRQGRGCKRCRRERRRERVASEPGFAERLRQANADARRRRKDRTSTSPAR